MKRFALVNLPRIIGSSAEQYLNGIFRFESDKKNVTINREQREIADVRIELTTHDNAIKSIDFTLIIGGSLSSQKLLL